eukprot:CAMPEP_0194753734 /NCGR_PEP_ID=MMETSP0323_2-20130528/7716_1 /TAXON_ID=2866 ORGANISM="Crypthecodinium cohnii, Strain Seligo" /NCGR_SAMPLE_ID=MMETSP0323_2 /ASSEMBLY_ACC=CAM_ASM_000346 /LENGTH=60 /DNA_ID=CAMNT_0039671803 /DNA_START=127 /DNA_END=309 /DNA_ORIENTATION=-
MRLEEVGELSRVVGVARLEHAVQDAWVELELSLPVLGLLGDLQAAQRRKGVEVLSNLLLV